MKHVKTFLEIEKLSRSLDVPVVFYIKTKRKSSFSTLISAILSSRTKDEITGEVMKKFLKEVKDFEDLKNIPLKRLEKLIYPVGFYKNKARNLKRLGEIILDRYQGKIPQEFDELIKLPGIGRKVANLILAEIFQKDTICVDTHVHRISNRLGWVRTKTPEETEKELRRIFPKKYWRRINKVLVAFGQGICKPLKPLCCKCPVKKLCPKVGVKKSSYPLFPFNR